MQQLHELLVERGGVAPRTAPRCVRARARPRRRRPRGPARARARSRTAAGRPPRRPRSRRPRPRRTPAPGRAARARRAGCPRWRGRPAAPHRASARTPRFSATWARRAATSSAGIGRKSTCRQRERIVAGNLSFSVEARMKTTWAGGSSRILRSARESVLGELVRLVQDEDAIAIAHREYARHVAQLAHVVDAAVGGGVDLEHVEGGPGRDLLAGARTRRTAPAWVPCRS